MTKYQKIAKILRERIQSGDYPPQSLLPNQTDLVKEFGVSRVTIKKAIEILTMEGLVYSQRGFGTKVLDYKGWTPQDYPFLEYDGLTKQLNGKKIDSQVIDFNVQFPGSLLQDKLQLKEHQPVYQIIRLRKVDDSPYVLEHTFMPVQLVPNLTEKILQSSIYQYLHETLHLSFAGAYRTIRADKSDSFDQKYLNCEETDPILEVEQLVYLKNGQPIEYSKSRNRYDTRSYSILDVLDN